MKIKISLLLIVFASLVLLNLAFPIGAGTWFSFTDGKEESWTLFSVFRLPEVTIALIAGASLAVAGLLLQTLLNNPLAGPSVLGLTSGSHLFVALSLMATGELSGLLKEFSVTFSAALGALIFGLMILFIASRLRSTVMLLLVGIMMGSFVSSITNILIQQADGSAVKSFSLWSMGSLQNVSLEQLPFILVSFSILVFVSFLFVKPLNALQLGESHAKALGINIQRTQWLILLLVALLSGLITAFCGPIGFVGLIVPNLIRLYFKTGNHFSLLVYSLIGGASVLLFCLLCIKVAEPYIVLPINSVTSFLGAPIVIFLLLKNRNNATV